PGRAGLGQGQLRSLPPPLPFLLSQQAPVKLVPFICDYPSLQASDKWPHRIHLRSP
ncbi:hypothetical protein CIB84_015969, partial [Bambusicola thoracicus]